MSRSEMDVSSGGIDPVVTHQRLQHHQVDTGLGQGGAEGMPQGVWMTGRHPGDGPVVTEHCPQPGRGQRLSTMRALGHQKQCGALRFRSLGQQVRLHQGGDVDIQRHPAFLVAVAQDPDPTPGNVHVADR